MALNSNLSKKNFFSLSGSLKYLVVESLKGEAHQWCRFRRSVCATASAFCSSCVCPCGRICTCAVTAGDRQRTLVLKCYRQPTEWDLHKCHNQLMHRCIGGYQGQLAEQARWHVCVYRDWGVGKNLTRTSHENNLHFLQVQKRKKKKKAEVRALYLNWIRPKCFVSVVLSFAVL